VSAIAAPPSPYKGLAPFDDSALDALLFFGREREIEVIVANLMASRLTVLYGVSGVGKTSLLRAGVAHRLRSAHNASVIVFSSWTGNPVGDLLDAVEAAAPEGVEPVRRSGSLADVLSAWTRRLDNDLYIVLDQFEEYFLYHEGERGAGTLADELPEALRRGGLRANFLLGIREDSLAQLDAFKARIPNLFANSLRLDRLDRVAARAAIEGPLERYNELAANEDEVSTEPELADAVLEQVAVGRVDLGQAGRGGVEEEDRDRIEAPYLQLVLERLWEVEMARGSRRLRLATLNELGGAVHIVEDHLERAMAELSPEQKDAAAAIYNHLVTPSGTKIAHRARDLAGYASVDEDETERVLQRLVEERIVRAGEDGAAGPRYEIFHDVLAEAVLAWRARHEADRRLEEERRAAARRHRRLLFVAIGAGILIAVLAAIAAFALAQRHDARAQARHARGRELAARALTAAPVAPEEAVRLALQAARYERSDAVADVLRTTLRNLRVKAVLQAGGPVTDVEFSPDGAVLVAASSDGRARLYRASDGKRVGVLSHGAPIAAAVFSRDGAKIATAGNDGFARVWDAKTHALRYALRHGGPVTSVTFSRDSRLIATTSLDGTARIWDATTGRPLRRLQHSAGVQSASFSGDGSLLVTALVPSAADGNARVWDVAGGSLRESLHQGRRLTAARFAPTGFLIVTAGGSSVARVWDARSGFKLHDLAAHESGIYDAEFSPSDRQIVTASADGTARVWNTLQGDLYGVLPNHLNYVVRATFSPDGENVATASRDRIARIFEPNGTLRATLVGHTEGVADVAFSEDEESVATASPDRTARLWDRRPQPDLVPLGEHPETTVAAVAFGAGGRRVVSVGVDGSVRTWRVGRPRPPLMRFRAAPNAAAVALSRDGRRVAAATASGFVRIRDSATGGTIETFRTPKRPRALAFSWDARELAIATRDRNVLVWKLGGGGASRTLGTNAVAVAFSPDGKRLLTAGADMIARVWDVRSGKQVLHPLRGHRDRLTGVAFSPDGRYLVTTSRDHDARVWDAKTGRSIWTLGHIAIVSGAAFSSDNRWLATAGPRAASVWDLATGRKLFGLNARDRLTAVAFSPHGWVIASGGLGGGVKTYDCRLCGGIDDLVRVAHERLANLRR
jgi:WD40 repeat protein